MLFETFVMADEASMMQFNVYKSGGSQRTSIHVTVGGFRLNLATVHTKKGYI